GRIKEWHLDTGKILEQGAVAGIAQIKKTWTDIFRLKDQSSKQTFMPPNNSTINQSPTDFINRTNMVTMESSKVQLIIFRMARKNVQDILQFGNATTRDHLQFAPRYRDQYLLIKTVIIMETILSPRYRQKDNRRDNFERRSFPYRQNYY
ncbi:hypothetical protein NPIL_74571, partial [Nephila pilipes]